MPAPARTLSTLLLLAALALGVVAVADARTQPRAGRAKASAKRPHLVVEGFQLSRAHGARGLKARRTPATRPAPPAPAPPPAAVPTSPLPSLLAPVAAVLETAPLPTALAPVTTTATLGVQTLDTPDYRMLLSRTTVPAGPVRVQLQNRGEDPHNLLLLRTDGTGAAFAVALTGPGQATTQTFALRAGGYRLVCSLTAPVAHETAGMRATLTVAP